MKKTGAIRYCLTVLIFACVCSIYASAQVWEFGSSGGGQNAFTAKGFAIKTESGKIQWLYSKFSNGGYDENGDMNMQDGGTVYTGTDNGVQYINAEKADGTTYQLYAFTNRNPVACNYLFAYQKKSRNGDFSPVSGFASHLGTPVRTSSDLTEFPNGINQQWAIPINRFAFEPGTLYEFGFQQGLKANNGITLVLQDDGAGHYYGYLWSPFSADEQTLYDKMKTVEYQFISSFTQVSGKDYYSVHFVPMRFSVQTYADLTSWNTAADGVKDFIDGITQSDYDSGKYSQSTIKNLKAELGSMQDQADTVVRYQLQTEADKSIAEMTEQITADMETAKTETSSYSDLTELNAERKAAGDFYDAAKDNVGTETGNYQKKAVDALKQAIDAADTLTKKDLQSDIDKAAADLANAVIGVKASLIQSDLIVLSDFVNGIHVTLKRGSVPDNVSLIVSRVDAADQRNQTFRNSVGSGVKEMVLYNILLYSGDEQIQPTQPMTVQFSVPDAMKSSDIPVYYSGGDLKAGVISSVRTENFIEAQSGSTGYFALVSFGETLSASEESPQTTAPAESSSQSGSQSASQSGSVDSGSSVSSAAGQTSEDQVNVIRQTDSSIKEEPDKQEKSLDITAGAGNSVVSGVPSGGTRTKEEITDPEIPTSQILKESNPAWLLLLAAIMGIFGAAYGGVLILKKLKKTGPR